MKQRAAISVAVILGVTYVTSSWLISPEDAEKFDEYEFTFISGELNTDQARPYANLVLRAKPPHFSWTTGLHVYGCQEIQPDSRTLPDPSPIATVANRTRPLTDAERWRPLVQCRFGMPKSWGGCAEIVIGVRGMWDDPDQEPYEVHHEFLGTYTVQPRVRVISWDTASSPTMVGTCPDPPLPVIEVPEPRLTPALMIAILALGGLAAMRRNL